MVIYVTMNKDFCGRAWNSGSNRPVGFY